MSNIRPPAPFIRSSLGRRNDDGGCLFAFLFDYLFFAFDGVLRAFCC